MCDTAMKSIMNFLLNLYQTNAEFIGDKFESMFTLFFKKP